MAKSRKRSCTNVDSAYGGTSAQLRAELDRPQAALADTLLAALVGGRLAGTLGRMETIEVSGHVTLRDRIAAQILLFRPGALGIGICAAFLVIAVWAMARHLSIELLVALLFVAVAAGYFIVFLPYWLYRTNPLFQHPITVQFSDEGVIVTTLDGTWQSTWASFNRWRSNRRVIIIFNRGGSLVIIPSTWFSSDALRHSVTSVLQRMIGHAT